MSTASVSTEASPRAAWLSLVGVSPEGIAGLGTRAREAIAQAEVVVGSDRQLALVRSLVQGECWAWPSPLSDGIARLWSRRGHATCVLASGDPFWYGIGATLAPQLEPGELVCYPAPSSLSLAAAQLGWPLQSVDVVSLHGRDLHTIIPYLHAGRRVFALSWNEQTPTQLAQLLTERGFGASRLHVLESLGGPAQRVRAAQANAFTLCDIVPLNLVALELTADAHALCIPCRGSLPDHAFEHDGQLTKQAVRALALSALAPTRGARLWDIGAGAGSIAIEWLLSDPACEAFAIEKDPVRCARIRRNARALGVPALTVCEVAAPTGLRQLGLPPPDAVFIGGGGSDPALFAYAWSALRSGGSLVMHAVTLETEAQLLALYAAHGGELCRFSIERAQPLGGLTGWQPARPVTQWKVHKP